MVGEPTILKKYQNHGNSWLWTIFLVVDSEISRDFWLGFQKSFQFDLPGLAWWNITFWSGLVNAQKGASFRGNVRRLTPEIQAQIGRLVSRKYLQDQPTLSKSQFLWICPQIRSPEIFPEMGHHSWIKNLMMIRARRIQWLAILTSGIFLGSNINDPIASRNHCGAKLINRTTWCRYINELSMDWFEGKIDTGKPPWSFHGNIYGKSDSDFPKTNPWTVQGGAP